MSSTESAPQVWTVLKILQWTAAYFERHAVDSPRLSAELLLSHVLQADRLRLYVDFERLLSTDELKRYRSLIERRVKTREPLQYIIGTTHFFGCNLFVRPGVLIPRPETEQLVEHAVALIEAQQVHRVLDIGTGSGCIATAIAKRFPSISVTAIDVSDDALACARENGRHNTVNNIEFLKVDILHRWIPEQPFDLIISNPPYIDADEYETLDPEVRKHEPKIALTDEQDGLVFYRRFAEIFAQLLSDNGSFFIELGYRSSEAVREILAAFHPIVYKDYEGVERFIGGHVTHS